jgi:hypothetical protein
MLIRAPEHNAFFPSQPQLNVNRLMALFFLPASQKAQEAIDFYLSTIESQPNVWKELLRKRRGSLGTTQYAWKNVSPLQLAVVLGNDTLVNKLLVIIPKESHPQARAQMDAAKLLWPESPRVYAGAIGQPRL